MATASHDKESSQGVARRYWDSTPHATYRNEGFAPNTPEDKMSLSQAGTMASTNLRFKNRVRQLPSGKRA